MNRTEGVLEIIRRSLTAGQTVEIEGLGAFRAEEDGRFSFEQQRQPQVFIAYVQEDLAEARRLRDGLAAGGCSPWLDKDQLLPGQNWPRAIERAIEISDAFVPCFSSRSIVKRGLFQSELRWALDCARRLPLEWTFVFPVRLESCRVPRRIEEQSQYVDLFPDWEAGLKRVVKGIRRSGRPRAWRML